MTNTDRYLRGWAKRIANSKGLPDFEGRIVKALEHIHRRDMRRAASYWKRVRAKDAVRHMSLTGATQRFVDAWKADSDADGGWPWYEHMALMIDDLGELLEQQRKERGAR